MKCWICGDEATSGEHMTKASDLRSLFGHVSHRAPLFMHTSERRSQAIPGVKSNKLKFKALLCTRCNNERTQPHDLAWEALSQYLRDRRPPIRPGAIVRLAPVFPGSVHRSMLNVHLYFLKLLGCLVVEHSIPIDIGALSTSILEGRAHPNVYLAFRAITDRRFHRHAGQSEVQTAQLHGRVAFASWFYEVGPLSVNVMYAEPNEHRKGLVNAWHPSSITKLIRIAEGET